jgi:hypothetical protein
MYKNLAAMAVACLPALHEFPRKFQAYSASMRAVP